MAEEQVTMEYISDQIRTQLATMDVKLRKYLPDYSFLWDTDAAKLDIYEGEKKIESVELADEEELQEEGNLNNFDDVVDLCWIFLRQTLFGDAFNAQGEPNFDLLLPELSEEDFEIIQNALDEAIMEVDAKELGALVDLVDMSEYDAKLLEEEK